MCIRVFFIGGGLFFNDFYGALLVYAIQIPNIDILDNEVSTLSDKEMIKSIIDLCLYAEIETSEEKKNRIRIIKKIKALVLEYRNLSNQ